MDYYQGYEDAMRQSRLSRTSGLAAMVLRLILSLSYGAFIYVPLLIVGYLIATKLSAFYSNDGFVKVGLTLAIAYLLFSFVYFLKGFLIGLKSARQYAWIILWIVCVVATCGAQSLLVQGQLETFFETRRIGNNVVWSWVGAAAVALLIYSHYQFLTNVAPRSVFWSYQIGFWIVQRAKKSEGTAKPVISPRYFENAPMKVSFRK
jgi:hypothetical protein